MDPSVEQRGSNHQVTKDTKNTKKAKPGQEPERAAYAI